MGMYTIPSAMMMPLNPGPMGEAGRPQLLADANLDRVVRLEYWPDQRGDGQHQDDGPADERRLGSREPPQREAPPAEGDGGQAGARRGERFGHNSIAPGE